ncbi:DUF292 domain-containing protein [Chloropicon primus]|uniref:DUF292 domain-containing protein n=1 Tax=Chloropicon primus TaxID=1764295 RepID=A0A5B8MPR8_9CHLO|nr:DUF292 domain-containing protein [Chloropicon primus]UPR01547.1 DUF292 domain-containing protein [Chloropicon primus]|mmetsp:Transcript_712/g.2104  ORF Transcript_712/g.2104 Transcript_712/m.2104 type:complete len:364 (-) Transcript_712:578-1669(-)|eukprot:QDZ22331.1 DUF292 domain-containing protein [Chloropicon primus]
MFQSLFGGGFDPNKCKTQLRLCVSRIRLLQNKKAITTRAQRKDIATLLATGKEDSARIRVEALIQEESTVLAFEILELYCELLSVRVELMKMSKGLPEDMQESVASVVYAANRCSAQLPELQAVKTQLQAKYGKEYVQRAQSDETCLNEKVNPRLVDALAIRVPDPKKKVALLSEIALDHNVDWEVVTGPAVEDDDDAPADGSGRGGSGGGQIKYPGVDPQYPTVHFTDEAGQPDEPPASPHDNIAVGTPVHPGDAPVAPVQAGKAATPPPLDEDDPSPPSAPVLKSAKGEASDDADGVPDLPDTPSPLNLNLSVRVVDVVDPPASSAAASGSSAADGGMDELSQRLDALKTGGQLPKPPKDF